MDVRSRIINVNRQLTTQEPICDLLNRGPVLAGGYLSQRLWLTHDGVLDEELFFEIFVNLLSGHDKRVADSRSMRRVGVIESAHKRAGGGKPVRGICNKRWEWPCGEIPAVREGLQTPRGYPNVREVKCRTCKHIIRVLDYVGSKRLEIRLFPRSCMP